VQRGALRVSRARSVHAHLLWVSAERAGAAALCRLWPPMTTVRLTHSAHPLYAWLLPLPAPPCPSLLPAAT
jgi:hypothetical protein